ncbi:MAG: universal stress protein [Deltaproteobacteria bacterium]|nr:universal stress protein [Deltaproteobacteria bacterium]
MYQTLLVPLDGSPRAESILPHVEDLATQFKSKVIFLQVVGPPLQFVNPSLYETTIQTDIIHEYVTDFKRKKEEISTYLAGIQEGFQKKGIEVKILVEQGAVVDSIISIAQRENADLIAIASHGRSGMSRVFYGSVAAGVMQKIDRPVLIIRSRNL